MKKVILYYFLCMFVFLNGCSVVLQKGRRTDIERIKRLQEELSELKSAKLSLEDRLSQEIKDKQIRLKMAKKGLVITFVAEVLFDSGKADLRKESLPMLDKVIEVLKDKVPEHDIGIEGHTDNQPIKYSHWKSNWELSAHRALSVLYYLEKKGIPPEKMRAIGYGEFHPVASNDTAEGRQLNRRVEIVILPKSAKVKKEILSQEEVGSLRTEKEEELLLK